MRTCVACGRDISSRRADARTCGVRCRKVASRRGIPAELVTRDRWVRYNARKVPLTLDRRPASSTDPSTWTSYQRASESRVGKGAGFVLNGDGVYCLDLDKCVANGVVEPAVARFLATLPRTYAEVSPSGTGVHVWFRGTVGRDGVHDCDGVRVEAYSSRRYITVTGDRLPDSTSTLARFNFGGDRA